MIIHTLKMCTSYLINIFLFFTGVEQTFFPSVMRRGCQVCVLYNSNSFHSIMFKLCLVIIHTLKMCTSYLINIFLFFTGVEQTFFPSVMRRGCQVCVLYNSNSFHSIMFKLCIMIVHTLKICTSYFVHI